MKFSFRLDKVLNYKKHLEKKAVCELVAARQEHSRIQTAIRQTDVRKTEVADECSQKGKAGVSVFEYRLYSSFLQKLSRDIHDRGRELAKSAEKIKAREKNVKQKTVGRRVLENLKEIHYQGYLEDAATEEQKAIDELILEKRRILS